MPDQGSAPLSGPLWHSESHADIKDACRIGIGFGYNDAGAETKLSAIFHGVMLLVCVVLLPTYLNTIPLSSLAAILLFTGYKLASPDLFRQMWDQGRYQFLPFILTLIAIVFTDLLFGIIFELAVSLVFILNSNRQHPIRRTVEKHIGGEVLHIELANQVSLAIP